MITATDSNLFRFQTLSLVRLIFQGMLAVAVLWGVVQIQHELESRRDRTAVRLEELGLLPDGKYLKPAVLGYHTLTADVLWLRIVQVVGKRGTTPKEYEWIYHALDVLTTLDPQYDYAFQVGGIVLTELAGRPDLSSRLLEKGLDSNPTIWQIPFYLGYNHYYHLHDEIKAAEYMSRAAQLPGRPAYLPLLATRLYAEAGNPEVALNFLAEMWRQTQDAHIKEQLETRIKELIIERDLRMLEDAIVRFRARVGQLPVTLKDLVVRGIVTALPQEPFGGEYRYDSKTGGVTSSTHPQRLKVQKPGQSSQTKPSPAPLRQRPLQKQSHQI
jgi:hypothetical protein